MAEQKINDELEKALNEPETTEETVEAVAEETAPEAETEETVNAEADEAKAEKKGFFKKKNLSP